MLRVESEVVSAVIHQGAALTVSASAQPEPRFSWHNGSSPLAPSESPYDDWRVDISTESHVERGKNAVRYSSTLTLSDVDVWDFTDYRVVVENDYGSDQTSLRLTQAS